MAQFEMKTLPELLGLNEDENPRSLKPGELRACNNAYRRDKSTGTRPGFPFDPDDYTSAISGTPVIQGIHEFRRNIDANRDLVVVAGGEVYKALSTKVTNATTTITSGKDNVWVFAEDKGRLYAAGGADGDEMWEWNGSASAVSPINILNGAGTPENIEPKYVFAKWGWVFAAGFYNVGTSALGTRSDDDPMTVRYPTLGTDYTAAANWNVANTIGYGGIGGVSGHGGDYITGFGQFEDNNGDWLLILTNRRIYTVTRTGVGTTGAEFAVADSIPNGCVHQRAFVSLGIDAGDAVYMSEKGIHSLRLSSQFGGREDTFLSEKIRKTFRGLNKSRLKFATGAYWPDEGIVTWAVSTGSSTTHDLIIALDVKNTQQLTPDNARFYVWHIGGGLAANVLAGGRGDDEVAYIYCGDNAGRVGRSDRDNFQDFGNGYPVSMSLHHDDFGLPGQSKTMGDMYVTIAPGGAYKPAFEYTYDFGTKGGVTGSISMTSAAENWGTMVWGVGKWGSANQVTVAKLYGLGSGETVSRSFSHGGSGEAFWISHIAQQVAVSGESSGIGDS